MFNSLPSSALARFSILDSRLLRKASSSDLDAGCLLRVIILQPTNLKWWPTLHFLLNNFAKFCATEDPSVQITLRKLFCCRCLWNSPEMPLQSPSVSNQKLTDKVSPVNAHLGTTDENLEKNRKWRLTVTMHASSSMEHLRRLAQQGKNGALATSFGALPRFFPTTVTCSNWNSKKPHTDRDRYEMPYSRDNERHPHNLYNPRASSGVTIKRLNFWAFGTRNRTHIEIRKVGLIFQWSSRCFDKGTSPLGTALDCHSLT